MPSKPKETSSRFCTLSRILPEGHVAMAAVYKAEGMKGSERQELNEALRINPSMVQARLTLARSFTQAKEAKAALDLLNSTPAQQKNTCGCRFGT